MLLHVSLVAAAGFAIQCLCCLDRDACVVAFNDGLCSVAYCQDNVELTVPKPAPQVLAAQQRRIEAMQRAATATVGVFGLDSQGGGSGVCISPDGYVLTNFHVSSPFGYRMRCGLNDGKMYEAILVGIDPTGDLALLKMVGRDDFPTAQIGDSDQVRVGQWCFAAGNPFVLATNLQPTVTYGLISGVRRYQYPAGTILEYSDCIQTDAAINPGNSGGPLFNMNGELIGINGRCSFEKRGRVNVGVGYAISIKQAMNFLWDLRSGRIVDHATLGFTVASDAKGRVTVSNILESSDAYRRGLRFGDEILRLGDRDIATTNQLKNVLGIYPDHWRIPLKYRNEDGVQEIAIRLQGLHIPSELEKIVQGADRQDRPRERTPQKKEPQPKDPPKPEDGGEADDTKSGEAKGRGKDALASLYEKRRGFGNYYFNSVELDRILEAQKQSVPVLAKSGTVDSFDFEARGKVVGEPTPILARISIDRIDWEHGDQTESVSTKNGWSAGIQRKTNNPIALALAVFIRWHSEGPRKLGEAVYLGRGPVLGREEWSDNTRITMGEVTAEIHTSPSNSDIELIELFADRQSDPAEVYFDRYEEQDRGGDLGKSRFPRRLRLQYGLDLKLNVDLESIEGIPRQAANGAASGGQP